MINLHYNGYVVQRKKISGYGGIEGENWYLNYYSNNSFFEEFYNKNIDRICFIIGNHHTPSKIDGLDFQIQWEADLLENLMVMDKEKEQEKIKKCIGENFKTNTGKRIAYNRFILD